MLVKLLIITFRLFWVKNIHPAKKISPREKCTPNPDRSLGTDPLNWFIKMNFENPMKLLKPKLISMTEKRKNTRDKGHFTLDKNYFLLTKFLNVFEACFAFFFEQTINMHNYNDKVLNKPDLGFQWVNYVPDNFQRVCSIILIRLS